MIKLQSCTPEFIRECFPTQGGSVVFDRKQEILFFLLENSVAVSKSRWLELQSPSGEHKSWWENGQLRSCGSWVNGQKQGEHKAWHENGQLSSCDSWVDGNPEGECKSWWRNGQLCSCGSWVNGLAEGEHKGWWENGQLSFCGSWVNGELIEEEKC